MGMLMSGNSNAINVRIELTSASGAGGQRAHDMRIGAQPDYVDATRTNLNRVLIIPSSGIQLREFCEMRREKRETKRAMKKNAGVCMTGVITFGHKAQVEFDKLTDDQQNRAYVDVARAVAARLNTSVTGLVVHKDEAANHAHFQCPGFDFDGNPIAQTAKSAVLSQLQTIAAAVVSKYAPAIERGRPKKQRLAEGENYADVVHKSAAEMRALLPSELEAKKALLAELDAKIEKNERLAARALEKVRENDDRAEKALKNAEIYEKRVAAAKLEKEGLDDELKRRRAAVEEHEKTNAANAIKIKETLLRLDLKEIDVTKRQEKLIADQDSLRARGIANKKADDERSEKIDLREYNLEYRETEHADAVSVYKSFREMGKKDEYPLTKTFKIIKQHIMDLNLSSDYNKRISNLFNDFLKIAKTIDISNGYKFKDKANDKNNDNEMDRY